uniref:hypothetical protein n=1 Tax=Succinivibrio sp. TaxID=2053619 RepID=UPI0038657CF7
MFPVVIFAIPVTIFNANAPCELSVVPPNARACVTLPVTFGPNVTGEFYPLMIRNDLGIIKTGALSPSVLGVISKTPLANGGSISE